MLGEEELGASFLITLKHRSVTPDLVDGASRCLADMLEPMEADSRVLAHSASTVPTCNIATVPSQDRPRKNDTSHNHGAISLLRPTSLSMALPEDGHWLSDLQCYVRSTCCEFFVATEADVKSNSSKRSVSAFSPVANGGGSARRGRASIGRIGIRCVFCRDLPQSARAAQSTSFPSQISGVYGAVVMMQCRHFANCHMMPEDVRATLERIKGTRNTTPNPGSLLGESVRSSSPNAPGRQQYWAESARKLGLVDTADGIRFASDCDGESSQAQMTEVTEKTAPTGKTKSKSHAQVTPELFSTTGDLEVPDLSLPSSLSSLMGETPLVSPEDKDLIPDYLFLAMAQMKPCIVTESDKVGCYKERTLGFTGMCCKHCGGQPGFGKYFPATVRSLAQTTTSQTIVKHVGVKCRLCPPEVRNAILALQQNSHEKGCNYSRGPASANDGRPKYGSRKVFFQRVWGRLHGEEVPEIPDFDTPPQPPSGAVINKKRSRNQEQEQQQHIVTPQDSDASEDDDVSSLDGSTIDSSSVASSAALEAQSNHDSNSEGDSDGDDSSLLTDDQNRRITVRAGGSQVYGRTSSLRNRQRSPILLTKNSKRKTSVNGPGRNKRSRLPQ